MSSRDSLLGEYGKTRSAARDGAQLITRLERLNSDLTNANRALQQRVEDLERLALVDPLTGLGNRRQFDAALGAELRRAVRAKSPLTVLICDVDGMHRYNERQGREAGDALLLELARALRRACRRGGDRAMRYGGDELGVILCDAGRETAETFAAALRRDLASLPRIAGRRARVNIGGCTFDGVALCSPKLLVERAVRALHRARSGGDCVEIQPFRR